MPDFYTLVDAQDGPKLTVNDIIKDPAVVPRRVLNVTGQRFIADQLLRGGPRADAGVVKFYQSNPLYSQTPSEVVGEFGQIPVSQNELGQLMITQTAKNAGSVCVSIEMVNRNDIDAVNLQISQVSNTMVRDWDGVFMAAALKACATNGHTVAASQGWTSATAATRKDIAEAMYQIVSSTLPGTSDQWMEYQPDTLVLNIADVTNMIGNDDTWKAWVGNVADESTAVTGKLPKQLFGLDPWQTWHIPAGTALVLQRNVAGFISDERPLQASPLIWREDTEEYRSNTVRQSAIGIDQPLAMCTITGIAG